jgi:hypothetical protein
MSDPNIPVSTTAVVVPQHAPNMYDEPRYEPLPEERSMVALSISREPALVLEEARKAAKALAEVIESKPNKVKLNGKTYLTFEDWQTVGRFYGVSAKVVSTSFVEYGTVKGFEARAVAVLSQNGVEVSGAEAMCLNDERNWKDKPMFQVKSMAQTRACAKALRNVLAFVPVLAGYSPTPAEEMLETGSQEAANEVAARKIAEHQAKRGKTAPKATSTPSKASPKQDGVVFIVGWPETLEGDVEVTGSPATLLDLGAIRLPENRPVGHEDHRLIKRDLMHKFFDVCRKKNVIVKDLTSEHVDAER